MRGGRNKKTHFRKLRYIQQTQKKIGKKHCRNIGICQDNTKYESNRYMPLQIRTVKINAELRKGVENKIR